MDKYEYDWEVTEILNDSEGGRRGAMVTYTPTDLTTFSEHNVFVPVPWHKATDQAHALEMLTKKIASRAPRNKWGKEENPGPVDQSDTITEAIAGGTLPTGEKRNS